MEVHLGSDSDCHADVVVEVNADDETQDPFIAAPHEKKARLKLAKVTICNADAGAGGFADTQFYPPSELDQLLQVPRAYSYDQDNTVRYRCAELDTTADAVDDIAETERDPDSDAGSMNDEETGGSGGSGRESAGIPSPNVMGRALDMAADNQHQAACASVAGDDGPQHVPCLPESLRADSGDRVITSAADADDEIDIDMTEDAQPWDEVRPWELEDSLLRELPNLPSDPGALFEPVVTMKEASTPHT